MIKTGREDARHFTPSLPVGTKVTWEWLFPRLRGFGEKGATNKMKNHAGRYRNWSLTVFNWTQEDYDQLWESDDIKHQVIGKEICQKTRTPHLQVYVDQSFPACAFFFFFKVEISSRTLIPLYRPGSVHSGSAS